MIRSSTAEAFAKAAARTRAIMQPTTRLMPRGLVAPPSAFVCRSCRAHPGHGRRAHSPAAAAAAAASPPSVTPTAGLARLASRRLISAAGPDASRYLQGVITSSILGGDGRPRTEGFYTAFLNAQGRVLYDAFVYPDTLLAAARGRPPGESFLVEVDASQADRLQRHIKRYKLRAKFAVRLLDEGEASIWHAWDTTNTTTDRQRPSSPPSPPSSPGPGSSAAGAGLIRLQDPRAPGLGTRLVTTAASPPFLQYGSDPPPPPAVDETAYQLHRYLHGVAEGQDEMLHEQALPQESTLAATGAIDFHKGCYVGQELTIRTRRGGVRKRILPCALYGEVRAAPARLAYRPPRAAAAEDDARAVTADMIPEGTSIGRAEKKARSAGKWLRGLGNVGLALCRLETMTVLAAPGESAAFDSEREFVMLGRTGGGDGDEFAVRVKAFVPVCLRRGLDGEATTTSRG